MSKRRVFDIDFEAEPAPAISTVGETRRGPMASAISENAAALTERQSVEADIRAENDRLAHEYVALKKDGAIVARVALTDIHTTKLIRDRAASRDPELAELKASIQAVGLSNPIHVEDIGGGYELIQGFRRLSAYQELYQETRDPMYAQIPATLQASGVQLDHLYRRMVDENLVRRDISFAEMAQLALSYSKRSDTTAARDAVDILFASAGRQKRSYIRHFAHLLQVLGRDLMHAEAIPRALGLKVVKAIESNPKLVTQIAAVLRAHPKRDASEELGILSASLTGPKRAAAPISAKSSAKTTLKLNRPEGQARCTATDGRFEVQLDRNFGAIDQRKLEAAVRSFLDQLAD
ncbi:ParB N-terminal domain-containing protein [Ascidiaceihabitans sp.]|uniref:ParB N-terminal domain-containing protein n=1 Tax=Ascidiaceihabitans sp. TaxID=1872644 RepID=UPI0032979AD6